jgi:hypothetical protein
MSLKEIEDEIKRLDLNQETIFLNIERPTLNDEIASLHRLIKKSINVSFVSACEGWVQYTKRQNSLFDVRCWTFSVRCLLIWFLAPFEGASSNHLLCRWVVIFDCFSKDC